MALEVRAARFGVGHGVKTTRIYRTSMRVAKITGMPVAATKAIVGENAFAHESGIHQHGMLMNPMTYEIMTPQSVGKTESTMVLGKLSGRHAFIDRLLALGYALPPEEADAAFTAFKELADRKKEITDVDLEALVSHRMTDAPAYYAIDEFQIQSGNKMKAMASITLLHDGAAYSEAATGDGPIDAIFNAATRVVGGDWSLSSYDIRAVTGGMDALGEVTVRVRHGAETHIGRGLSTDVIEASIRAYINAVNRAMAMESRGKEV
jgi:2-isopropylmalate synthase